jgi:hypothetical protein
MRRREAIINIFEKGPPRIFEKMSIELVPDEMIRLIGRYLDVIVHTEQGHYKFWTWQEEGSQIKYIWGKITSISPDSVVKYETKFDARNKQRSKLDKGYVQIGWPR